MAGYIRQDVTNNIADGNVINASDFDNEYNAIEAAFNATTGHTHDGTSAEGAPITKVGPAQDLVVGIAAVTPKTDNTLDLGSAALEFKDLYIDGTANIDSLVADTADINAGTIDGVAIGGSVRGAGSFTTLDANGNTTLGDAVGDTVTVNGTTTFVNAAPTLTPLTASQAVFTNASKTLVSNAITGTGNVVMSASPTLTGTITAAAANFSGAVALNGNSTIGDASSDTVTINGTSTFTAKPTVQLTSAATNTVTQALRIDSQSSGTPAAGIGVGLEFAAETSSGNTEVGATIEAITTDVTSTSEDFDLAFKLMINGAAATEVARFKSTGLSLATGDTYQINNTDVLSATSLGSGVTSSSLTSVGTIGTGTWQGTVIGSTYGGTGVNNGGRTLTINTNSGTLAFGAASKTLTINNSLTFSGTDASSVAFGTGGTVAYTGGTLAQFAATTSAQLAGVISDETGSGSLVFATSPSLTTPTLGVATATSINKVAITEPATSATLTIAEGKTLTASNSLTFAGTDATTMTFPTTSATIARTDQGQTFTGTQTVQAASTQDAVAIAGRAGGTGSYVATLTTATLAASVTHTLPAITGTLATLANTAQTFAGATTFTAAATFNGNLTFGNANSDTISVGGTRAVMANGSKWQTTTTAGNNFHLAAYDTDGAVYSDLVTLTAGTTPTLNLNSIGDMTMQIGGATQITLNGSTVAVTGALSATADSSFTSTGALQISTGTTAERPTGAAGKLRFNTSITKFEGYNGTTWASVGGGATGGGADEIFIENGQTVTTNYSIPSAKNAMSTGPITVNSGVTVTVPSGSRWVVL